MTSPLYSPLFKISQSRSQEKVRNLSVVDLDVQSPPPDLAMLDAEESESQSPLLETRIEDDDPILEQVRILLDDNYAGVILVGPPGTSKSWYAAQIAARLADLKSDHVRFIQFHPSYQYEDFVEGFVPVQGQGFVLEKKHLLEMCDKAWKAPGQMCVLVIDELSRSDPGRVFGEALTYVEMTKRETEFRLASGTLVSIPRNLIFIATMNPWDRGVDEVDVALERRFAKIAMEPSADQLERFLLDNGMAPDLLERVLIFFNNLQRNTNTYARVGHAYFYWVKDEAGLRRLWQYQLRFLFEKAFRLDPEGYREVEVSWRGIFVASVPATESGGEGSSP